MKTVRILRVIVFCISVFSISSLYAQSPSPPFYFKSLNKTAETSDSTAWGFNGSLKMDDSELNVIDSIILQMTDINGIVSRKAFKFIKVVPGMGRFMFNFKISKVAFSALTSFKVAFRLKNGSQSEFYVLNCGNHLMEFCRIQKEATDFQILKRDYFLLKTEQG